MLWGRKPVYVIFLHYTRPNNPVLLTDQHLIAEYNEILMLGGYIKKYPDCSDVPKSFRLGLGHKKFFKDKVLYLEKRHKLLREEMQNRDFQTNKVFRSDEFPEEMRNDWSPNTMDIKIIMARLTKKINQKPHFYRYYSKPLLNGPEARKNRGICIDSNTHPPVCPVGVKKSVSGQF